MRRVHTIALSLTVSLTASVALYAQTPPDLTTCPVTRFPKEQFVPPAPYMPRPPEPVSFWYGSNALWTELWSPPPWTPWRAQQPVRMYWASTDKSGDENPALTVTIRRLDRDNQELVFASPDAVSFTPKRFGMIASATFPSAGCWQVIGEYRGKKLKYVVQIEPAPSMQPMMVHDTLSVADSPFVAALHRQTLPEPVPPQPRAPGAVVLNGHDCTTGDRYCEDIACGGRLGPCTEQELKARKKIQQQFIRAFHEAREMLLAHDVPFDPNIILEPNWRFILKPIFDQMPEMKRTLWLGQLRGLIMADTLYVPAITTSGPGPTMILVNHIVVEGCQQADWGIGPGGTHTYPVGGFTYLGTTLNHALKMNHLSREQFEGKYHLPPFSVIRGLDLPKCKPKSLTVDRSAGKRPLDPTPPSLWPDPPALPDYPKE